MLVGERASFFSFLSHDDREWRHENDDLEQLAGHVRPPIFEDFTLPRHTSTVVVVGLLLVLACASFSFVSGCFIFLAGWVHFILDEDNYFHSAQEHENRSPF